MTASGMSEPIVHEYTYEIVCPHCGDEIGDSWEFREDDGELECEECGGKFNYTRNISITYSTAKA